MYGVGDNNWDFNCQLGAGNTNNRVIGPNPDYERREQVELTQVNN